MIQDEHSVIVSMQIYTTLYLQSLLVLLLHVSDQNGKVYRIGHINRVPISLSSESTPKIFFLVVLCDQYQSQNICNTVYDNAKNICVFMNLCFPGTFYFQYMV